MNTIKMTKIGD